MTGAASGIGEATARRLHDAGWSLALLDRDGDGATRLAAELGATAHVVDLSRPDEVAGTVDQVLREHPEIEAVVNVAGAVRGGDGVSTSDDDWRWNLDVNASSAFYVCRGFLPALVRRGRGSIVNFGSLTALHPMASRAGYAAAKGAVIALTRQLAFEYGPAGVSVNTVCPGAVRTPLLAARLRAEPEVEGELSARIPARRLGAPEEVAEVVELLVSGRARYLTGQTIVVDGGQSLG